MIQMPRSALIGHTGFVGSNLARDGKYDAFYNSTNIDDIRGQTFDRVVCAGVPAVKWWANANPDADLANIQRLMACLVAMEAGRFTLISTVDVYGTPSGVDESVDPRTADLHPYGRHRLLLEEWAAGQFNQTQIVRLPALFGPGLKKNVIFDMRHGHMLETINPRSQFQWYSVRRLAADLEHIEAAEIGLINIASEPIETEAIHQKFFADKSIGSNASAVASYDVQTVHASLFGRAGRYHFDAASVLDSLSADLSEALL